MHLMDERPAQFGGKCLHFSGRRVTRLATSLKQIRQEQDIDRAFGGDASPVSYSYVRISRGALSAGAKP